MALTDEKHVRQSKKGSHLRTWFSRADWDERVVTFNASWFTVSMGTGAMTQNWTNFPYEAEWERTLAYCFWVLSIALFVFFSILGLVRALRHPDLTRQILADFYQTSYLGAIPISVDVIAVGFLLFYGHLPGCLWLAYALFWVATAMSIIVGGIIVFITCAYQEAPSLDQINGVWLLSFIPLIVTSSTGAVLIPYLPVGCRGATIVVSYLLWSLGTSMCMVIVTIYFWRLVRHKLPARDAIVSSFIPMGPAGMGAYSILNLSIGLAAYIPSTAYNLSLDAPPEVYEGATQTIAASYHLAIAASIHWLGVIVALFLAAFSTFWLLQGVLAVGFRSPKQFNVGLWGSVFPNAVYTNALCRLSQDLNNRGLRGWAATMVVVTSLAWLFCAAGTLWVGVWKGQLLYAPGLEGWNEKKYLEEDLEEASTGGGGGGESCGDAGDSEMLEDHVVSRVSRPDGTYHAVKKKRRKGWQADVETVSA